MLNPLAPSGAIGCETSAGLARISLTRPPAELGVNVPTFTSTPGVGIGPGLLGCDAVWRSSAPITRSPPRPRPISGEGGGVKSTVDRVHFGPPWHVAHENPGT